MPQAVTHHADDSVPDAFETKRLTREDVETFIRADTDDSAILKSALIDAITVFSDRGLPWTMGNERIVFYLGRNVIKLPLRLSGVFANTRERRAFSETMRGRAYCPMAACRTVTNADGIVMLLMRTVSHVKSYTGLPDWVLSVDCTQVGHNAKGQLVAYDL